MGVTFGLEVIEDFPGAVVCRRRLSTVGVSSTPRGWTLSKDPLLPPGTVRDTATSGLSGCLVETGGCPVDVGRGRTSNAMVTVPVCTSVVEVVVCALFEDVRDIVDTAEERGVVDKRGAAKGVELVRSTDSSSVFTQERFIANGLPRMPLPFTVIDSVHSSKYTARKDKVYCPFSSSTTLALMAGPGMGDFGRRKASMCSPPVVHRMFLLSNEHRVNVIDSDPSNCTVSGLGSTVQLTGQAPSSITPNSSIVFKRTYSVLKFFLTPF